MFLLFFISNLCDEPINVIGRIAVLLFLVLVFMTGCEPDPKIPSVTQYSFALDVAADSTGSVNIDTANSTDNGNYDDGTFVIARAITNSQSVFLGWYDAASGGAEVITDNPYIFSLKADTALYAKWTDYTDMVSVPGGTYTQTDGTYSFDHTISDFKLGQYEVTYELWYAVYHWAMRNGYDFANSGTEGNNGTAGAVPTIAKYEPVTTVNWRDTIVWCNA